MACTASSSPPQGSLLSRTAMFRGHHLIPPSSPTAAYMDGEISPSFDASFASSMSISADVIVEPSPLAIPRRTQCRLSSSPNAMDISPAPIRAPIPIFRPPIVHAQSDFAIAIPISTVPTVRPTLARARSTISAPRDYPFFSNLFGTTASAKDVPNKVLTSRSLSPETFLKPLPSIRQRSSAHLDWEESACTITRPEFISNVVGDTDSEGEESGLEGEMGPPTSIPKRSPLPTAWSASRHTAPAGELLPPPMPPLKRLSEPAIPTYKSLESSPMRMDVDPNSPGSASDFSAPRLNGQISDVRDLGDCFDGDLSPMPLSRKRFLPSELSPGTHSPTPLSSGSTFGMVLSAAPLIIPNRRVFEKASTVSSATSTAFIRRRPSSNNLNPKRPGPTSSAVFNMGPPPRSPVGEDTFKRQAQVFNGKPAAQKIRRAYSVAGPAGMLSTRDPNVPDSYRASTAADGFFQAFAKRSGNSNSIDIGMMDGNARRKQEDGSPLTGFRTQEEKGKSLPCFGVKEDGLMRISSETLSGLQRGDFSAGIKNYLIIDCRFSYEYDGGHISEAVNLPTTPEVEQALLALEDLPLPSTSEEGPAEGKTVLIFHCEFSAKRAPTSAKHLRSKDRLKNVGDYPRVHYPEVYILQGGYADFYKNYPDQCAGGYLPMDDPDHNAKRSVDLHAFRQQKRQFSRASSFTFGQAHSASSMLLADSARVPLSRQQLERTQSLAPSGFVFPIEKAQDTMSVHEEEHELADSSFGTSSGSSPGGQGSPCPPASKGGRPSLKIIGKELLFGGRRPLQRAQTSSVAMFGR